MHRNIPRHTLRCVLMVSVFLRQQLLMVRPMVHKFWYFLKWRTGFDKRKSFLCEHLYLMPSTIPSTSRRWNSTQIDINNTYQTRIVLDGNTGCTGWVIYLTNCPLVTMERTGNLKAWCSSLIAFKWHSSKVLSALKWAPQFTAFVAPPVSDTWKTLEQLESKSTVQESARVEMIPFGCDCTSDLFILHCKIFDFKMLLVAALWWRKYRGQSELTILLFSKDVRPIWEKAWHTKQSPQTQ